MGAVFVLVGAVFALTGLWAVNHPDAVGSSGIWTSWVSPPVRRALAWIQLLGGMAFMVVGLVS